MAVVIGGAAPILTEVVAVGGEVANAGRVGVGFGELVVDVEAEGFGVDVAVDEEAVADVVAFGVVFVDVLIGAVGADAAGWVGGIVGAGVGGVGVACEVEVVAAGELVVDGDLCKLGGGFVEAQA